MSIKSRSKDSSSASTTSSSRSEGDSGSEVDSSSNVSDESDESNFTLVEIHYSDTKTVCKLCFRPAQVLGKGVRNECISMFQIKQNQLLSPRLN